MVIRDSTHAQTSLTFNAYYPGYAVPILDCAAGHVYLAYAREEERESLLDSLARLGDRDTHHMLQLVREGGVIETVRASGPAARGCNRFTQNPGKTSSIAVDRKSVMSGKRVYVRVDLGGRRIIKKKNKKKNS